MQHRRGLRPPHDNVKAITKIGLCDAPTRSSGRMHVVMKDGSKHEFNPGDVGLIPPRHDAWVVGNEPVVVIHWAARRTTRRANGTRHPPVVSPETIEVE